MKNEDFKITPSDIMEFLYCPRFIYFERVLRIPEHQELRVKVTIGREIHKEKSKTLGNYLRKKLGVIDKKVDVKYFSPKLSLTGIVDEALFLDDGTIAPLDYKFARYPGFIHKPLYYQSMIYSLLLEELFDKPSLRGYVVFVRSKNALKEIKYPENKREKVINMVDKIYEITMNCIYPDAKVSNRKCYDCTYRRICTK